MLYSNLESAWRSSMPWRRPFRAEVKITSIDPRWSEHEGKHDSGWKGIVSERLCAIWTLFLTLQTAESGLSCCSPLTQYATCTWGSHYLHWIWVCTYILETPLCSQHPLKRTQLSPSSGKTQQAKISPCPQSGKLHIKEWTPMNPFLFLLTQTTIKSSGMQSRFLWSFILGQEFHLSFLCQECTTATCEDEWQVDSWDLGPPFQFENESFEG